MHGIFGHFDLVSISALHCDFFVLLAVVVNIQCVQSRVFIFSVSCKCGLKNGGWCPFSKLRRWRERTGLGFLHFSLWRLGTSASCHVFAPQLRRAVFDSWIFKLLVLSGEWLAPGDLFRKEWLAICALWLWVLPCKGIHLQNVDAKWTCHPRWVKLHGWTHN